MKRIYIVAIAFIAFSLTLQGQSGSELDNEAGTSMMPIVNTLTDVVKAMEQSDIEIVHVEFDLLFQDGKKEIFRSLSTGYTYGFMAYGDYRINKIGIDLYKESGDSWEYMKSGELSEGVMSLMFQTVETAQYKIVLRPLEFVEGYSAGHYGLIILHD